jgi:hypothetical protein
MTVIALKIGSNVIHYPAHNMNKKIIFLLISIFIIVYIILGVKNLVPFRHCYEYMSTNGQADSSCEWGFKHNYVF